MTPYRIAPLAAAGLALALGLAAPAEARKHGGPSTVTNAAKSSCLSAVNSNYGGKVKSVKVTGTEFSQANSTVMVKAIGVRGSTENEQWKCLVSQDGKVQDLSVVTH